MINDNKDKNIGTGRFSILNFFVGLLNCSNRKEVTKLFVAISTTIFLLELLVMYILHLWEISCVMEIFLDPVLLSILTTPILYVLIVKPLKNAIYKAEVATESKSQFLANMSHEIRTPLNSVIGFSDLLLEEELTEKQYDYVKTIHINGNHLLQLINDILDFSKIEARKLDIELIECSLESIFSMVTSLSFLKAEEKGLKFKINSCKEIPPNVVTDPIRLTQCLVNLTNNAIKFTEKGHVYINVSLEERDGETHIRFDVEDTGIGISADNQKKIFEAFSQAEKFTTRKYGGTGLGLAITKKLVELLNGQLTISSDINKGSVFSIVLPAYPKSTNTIEQRREKYVSKISV